MNLVLRHAALTKITKPRVLSHKPEIVETRMEKLTLKDLAENYNDSLTEYEDCVLFGKPEAERLEALRVLQEAKRELDGLKDSMQQYEAYLANLKATFARLQSLHRGEE